MKTDPKKKRLLAIARDKRAGRERPLPDFGVTKPIRAKRKSGDVYKYLAAKLVLPITPELKVKITQHAAAISMTQAEFLMVILLELVERVDVLQSALENYPARREAMQRQFQAKPENTTVDEWRRTIEHQLLRSRK